MSAMDRSCRATSAVTSMGNRLTRRVSGGLSLTVDVLWGSKIARIARMPGHEVAGMEMGIMVSVFRMR